MARQTSRDAYHSIEGTIGFRQRAVYNALHESGPMTNNELAELLGWRINTINPRVNELVKMGFVREEKRRPCKITGFKAIAWEVPRREQPGLFDFSL
jgi:predicted transcriptional regulator